MSAEMLDRVVFTSENILLDSLLRHNYLTELRYQDMYIISIPKNQGVILSFEESFHIGEYILDSLL